MLRVEPEGGHIWCVVCAVVSLQGLCNGDHAHRFRSSRSLASRVQSVAVLVYNRVHAEQTGTFREAVNDARAI